MSVEDADYGSPLVREFHSGAFRRSTKAWHARIDALVSGASGDAPPAYFRGKNGGWVGTAIAPPSQRIWRPKVYLCVLPASYWRVVGDLIGACRQGLQKGSPFDWKFYIGPSGFERPDKIVLYGARTRDLPRLVELGLRVLPSRGVHALRHAASLHDLGLGPKSSRGIYVGLDPPVGTSWRTYRVICCAWADAAQAHLERYYGGRHRWLERMNVSTIHEGPHRTRPPTGSTAFIRRSWRNIVLSLDDAELRRYLLLRMAVR